MSLLAHRGQRASSKCGRNTPKEKRRIPLALKGGNRLKLSCRNVRTMLGACNSTRPERRSALITHELARLDIDLAALSEIRFSEEGCVRERGAGCTLYWSGQSTKERRLSDFGFMVRDFIVIKLTNLPNRLYRRVWKSNNLKKDLKINFYKVVMLKTLLYSSQSWVTYRRHLRLIDRYHQRCLKTQLRWAGRLQDGGPSPTKDGAIWRIIHWPS